MKNLWYNQIVRKNKGGTIMKKILVLCLSLVILMSLISGCVKQEQVQEKTPVEEQTITKVEDDGTMRILMIGGSLGYDTMYMMPAVLKNEGVENFAVGILYRSAGLKSLTPYAKSGNPEFAYLEYVSGQDQAWRRADCNGYFLTSIPDEATDKYIEDGSIAVSAEFGLKRMDWDVVVIMSASNEITNVTGDLNMKNADAMMEYVKVNDVEPATVPEFGWHMVWSLPVDSSLWNAARRDFMEKYYPGQDATAMYEDNVRSTKDIVLPAIEGKVTYVFPCATALQNAKTSTLVTDKDIHRDFIHGTDYARLIAAYTWYCGLTGVDIRDCKFGPVPNAIVRDAKTRITGKDYEMTEELKNLLIESVENAYKESFAVTQSAYQ